MSDFKMMDVEKTRSILNRVSNVLEWFKSETRRLRGMLKNSYITDIIKEFKSCKARVAELEGLIERAKNNVDKDIDWKDRPIEMLPDNYLKVHPVDLDVLRYTYNERLRRIAELEREQEIIYETCKNDERKYGELETKYKHKIAELEKGISFKEFKEKCEHFDKGENFNLCWQRTGDNYIQGEFCSEHFCPLKDCWKVK